MSLPDGERLMDDLLSGPDTSTHTSMILQLFVELLGQRKRVCLLDLGPIIGTNIAFFSHRASRLCVCDLFGRLDQALSRKRPLDEAWRNLNYPPAHFDGILLWDFLDHLENVWALRMVQVMSRWIKPEGMVVVLSGDQQRPQTPVTAFGVDDDFRLQEKPIPRLHLPVYPRQNREVMALMHAFSSIKSFIYRNGIREYLFRFENAAKRSI